MLQALAGPITNPSDYTWSNTITWIGPITPGGPNHTLTSAQGLQVYTPSLTHSMSGENLTVTVANIYLHAH